MKKFNNDAVNRPSHYTDGKIEVIDFIEDKGLDFCLGNAVKYIARAGKKDPEKEIEDLQKAIWYINRRIQELEQESNCDIEDLPEFNTEKVISHTYPVKAVLLGEKDDNNKSTLGESLKVANQCDQCSSLQKLLREDEDECEDKEEDEDVSETLGGWTDEDLMPREHQETENDGQINTTDEERDKLIEAYEKAQLMYTLLHVCDPSYTWEQFLEDCKQAKAELEAEQQEKDYNTPIM